MNERDARLAVVAALRQKGFEQDFSHPAHPRFRGRLDPTGLNIPVSIEVADFDFVTAPVVRIEPGAIDASTVIPHVSGADDQLCYLDIGSTVLDRYDPGGTVLRCLLRAEQVLGDAVRGKLNDDFADEYANYWSAKTLLVDLPPDAIGETEIFWVFLDGRDLEGTPILARKGKLARSFREAHERARGPRTKPSSEACWVVRADVPLGFDPGASIPPRDLAGLLNFLAACGTGDSVVDEALKGGAGLSRSVAIRAPNAFCLARILIPKKFDRDEFMKSRKQSLPRTARQVASEIPLDRWRGFPIDASFLYGRNLGSLQGLAGRKIGLIGCGTIGGFLALQLAQCGAGTLGGRLVLFDNQILTPSNLGRHLLGLPHLGRNKAEGCAEVVRTQLPFLDVEARAVDILRRFPSLDEFDLVIDATGEEALSLALNDFAVNRRPKFPPIVYSWILGNGAAAQAMLCDGAEHACYKCAKPELLRQPRVRVLSDPEEVSLHRMGACGDGLYAPFPVSVSMTAAALALDLVLAWANGNSGKRFRTRPIDMNRAFKAKDTNLKPSPVCPACRSSAT